MAGKEEIIIVPDIGTDDEVTVIEVNVSPGDSVDEEDALITLESEKASMEVPSPQSGIVKQILVSVDDKVKKGSQIVVLELSDSTSTSNLDFSTTEVAETHSGINTSDSLEPTLQEQPAEPAEPAQESQQGPVAVHIPDIGTDDKVDVIEINIAVGDSVEEEDALITLESEKASMEVPSPVAGIIQDIQIAVGDKVAKGDLILYLDVKQQTGSVSPKELANESVKDSKPASKSTQSAQTVQTTQATQSTQPSAQAKIAEPVNKSTDFVYASPSILRFANELGVDLTRVVGTGRKGRIVKTDVEKYVKGELAKTQSGDYSSTSGTKGSGVGLDIASLPKIDFAKFGEVSVAPLSRIKKYSAANLHRNWVMVPHVTQFDDVDITDLENFRQKYKKQAEAKGYKLTPLVFLMKAAAGALRALPQFNVSLDNDGVNIIQKHYYHIGVAVDTPNGLVVPVIRDVDSKGLFQLAKELGEVSQKARDGKLTANDMQGSCFTISSLGGIGGTAFTPIVNMPDVAILGVSKSQYKPVYINKEFVPRLMLPLSLSYDHRAIDGADGARFITKLNQLLSDITQILL